MKYFLSLLAVLVFVGAGCTVANDNAAVNTNTSVNAAAGETETTPQTEEDNADVSANTSVDATAEETGASDVATTPGQYVAYSSDAISDAATNGTALLFFHAPWCPTCKALNNNIEANASDIPDGLTIFKVDYDSELELRKKYGVTYQHTLVQVDASGNLIKKWSGGNTLASIEAQLQ